MLTPVLTKRFNLIDRGRTPLAKGCRDGGYPSRARCYAAADEPRTRVAVRIQPVMATDRKYAQFFISYAREDKAFALALRRALASAGRLAWLDLKSIGALAPWRTEIAAAIDAADVFVFVISPDAVASAACRDELKLAVEGRKRLAPVVWRETDAKAVPAALSVPNWLFAGAGERSESLAARLIAAADRDPDWIREHTRLLTRAREWRQHRRESSRLLAGQGLQDALRWLADSGRRGDRPVSALHAEYIEASRLADAAAAARQRELYLKALARQLAAQSELTRDDPDGGPAVAALLGLESMRKWHTVEGDRALRRSLVQLPRAPVRRLHIPACQHLLLAAEGGFVVGATGRLWRLWDLAAGTLQWQTRLPFAAAVAAFGAEGDCLVVDAEDGRSAVLSLADGSRRSESTLAEDDRVRLVCVAAGFERSRLELRRRSMAKGVPPLFLRRSVAQVRAASPLLGGRVVAAVRQGSGARGGYTQVIAWNAEGGAPRKLWELYGLPLESVIGGGGTWIALTTRSMVSGPPTTVHVGRLADLVSGAYPDRMHGLSPLHHDDPIEHMAADGPDRLIVYTGGGTMVHVWEPMHTRLVGRWRVGRRCNAATPAPDGKGLLVGLTADRGHHRVSDGIALVDAVGRRHLVAPGRAPFGFDADGRVVAVRPGEITVWDSDTAVDIHRVPATYPAKLRFSADSSVCAIEGRGLGLWIVPTVRDRPPVRLSLNASPADFAFQGGRADRLVVVGNPGFTSDGVQGDPHARLWDLTTGKVLLLRRREATLAVHLGPDGRQMATWVPSLGEVRWVDVETGRVRRRIPAENVDALRWDAAGTHLACEFSDGRVNVWSMTTGRVVASFERGVPRNFLDSFDVASGRALVNGVDGCQVIDVRTGAVLREALRATIVDHARDWLGCIAKPDRLEVRALGSGRRLARLTHPGLDDVQFVPGSDHVVTCGDDGSVRVWHIGTGDEVARMQHPDRVFAIQVSPDGHTIASHCKDEQVRLWAWRVDDLAAEVERRVGRSLSAEEFARFLPDPETRPA